MLRLPKYPLFACYTLWVVIALLRTLSGFLLTRSVGWTYPRLFSHWALYESNGGFGPPFVTCLLTSGARLDLGNTLTTYLRGHKWQVTESFCLLVLCSLLAGLDHAPWAYGIALALAILAIALRLALSLLHPSEITYPHHREAYTSFKKRIHVCMQLALSLFALTLLHTFLDASRAAPTTEIPTASKDGVPFLDIIILSYPRPNDTPSDDQAILHQTISSYLPYISSAVTLSVFTHSAPFAHPAFSRAQTQFQDAPITFVADQDVHPDAYPGQHLHLTEAFRWLAEKEDARADWVMLVEDDFPVCGEWGWQAILRVMHALERGHVSPSSRFTKMWGGFVGTGGSGLIIHRTLLPVLAQTLRLHALIDSQIPEFARRPADVIIQDCLLGHDPLCPTAPSSKDVVETVWFTRPQPTMVITSRLVMDHIGGNASTTAGRVYDAGKWRCGWRHPFHGRSQVVVIPV